MNHLELLVETGIPANLLKRSRIWFSAQMARLEQKHGEKWQENRQWLADYLNAELRELIAKQPA